MLITFRKTHYTKKKKKTSHQSPIRLNFLPLQTLFCVAPPTPFSYFKFSTSIGQSNHFKKKKKRHTFYPRPTFHSSKRSFGTTFFDIKQLSSHFPPSHQISVPKWGNSYYSIAIAIFFLLSETYINRSDKLGSRRKKFKLAGGIGSLNIGCRKKQNPKATATIFGGTTYSINVIAKHTAMNNFVALGSLQLTKA